jgi:hypothetical protein
MAPRKKPITECEYNDLVESINKLTTVLTEHSEELKNHKISIANLVKTIEKLDSTIRNESHLQVTPPSPQLKSMVVEFVETYINPRFYNAPGYTAIGSSPKITHARLPSGR